MHLEGNVKPNVIVSVILVRIRHVLVSAAKYFCYKIACLLTDIVAESCLDGIKNQEETDIDCGGDRCAKCEDLKKCNNDCDCISGLCENNQCACTYDFLKIEYSELNTNLT